MAIEKRKIKKTFYSVLKAVADSDKCPPQAKLIVSTIVTAGGRIEREELMTLLKRPVEEGGLKTNQTAERILGFYRPKLTEMGVLKEEKVEEEIEVEVPDKPAPATTAAAASADGAPATNATTDATGAVVEPAPQHKKKK
jgi:hypothetical protein